MTLSFSLKNYVRKRLIADFTIKGHDKSVNLSGVGMPSGLALTQVLRSYKT
jgi:hypothetical protein